MLIHDAWGPSGRDSAVAIHLPAAVLMPSAEPDAIIRRQSAAIWFQPASMESGHTLSASSGWRRRIGSLAASEAAIAHLVVRRLAMAGAARISQSAVQSIMRGRGTRGLPNSATMRAALLSQPASASVPVSLGARPKRWPNSWASQRTEIVSGPVTLMGVVGVVARARQRSATALASPCQMTLTCPIDRSISAPSRTLVAMSCSTP